MNAQRLSLALAVLLGFVLGVAVGTFVGGNSEPASTIGPSGSPKGSGSHIASPLMTIGPDAPAVESVRNNGNTSEDPVTRFWTTLTMSDDNERHAVWLAMLPNLTASEAQSIRELFLKMEAEGRRYEFEWSTFWPRWGEVDAAGALDYLQGHEPSDKQAAAAAMILRGWAKADAAAARAWLTANTSAPYFNEALRGYIDGLAKTDLDRATSEAASFAKGHNPAALMETLADQALQQRRVGGMLNWWQSLSDDADSGNLRRQAVGAIASRLTSLDPRRAQDWLAELSGTPYRSDEHIGSVAVRVASNDPMAAVTWVSSLTPSPADGHYTAIGRTIRAWAQQDRPAAEQWVLSLPPCPLRDQALANFPGQQARADGSAAQSLLDSYRRALPK